MASLYPAERPEWAPTTARGLAAALLVAVALPLAAGAATGYRLAGLVRRRTGGHLPEPYRPEPGARSVIL